MYIVVLEPLNNGTFKSGTWAVVTEDSNELLI